MKKEILCFGDSNTWGAIGRWAESEEPSERFPEDVRWTGVLQRQLGGGFHIIEEGLGGRTTIYTPEAEPWKTGEPYLLPCLRSHRPLDLVIMMLGTNDLQLPVQPAPGLLGDGISRLVDIIQSDCKSGRGNRPAKILLLAPVEIRPSHPEGRTAVYSQFGGDSGRRLSLAFPEVYSAVAKQKGCYFLNAAQYASPCEGDGVHFDAGSHRRLGLAVADYIKENIFPTA